MPRPQYDFAIKDYRPVARITYYAHAYGGRVFHLEPELIQITTQKAMGQPYGTFSIQLVDRVGTDGLTWQQRAQMMDYIEIYMGNDDQHVPIVMRGVVHNAQRIFDIPQQGGPERYTQINGYDLGYLFTANRVRYLWQFDPTAIVAEQYQLSAVFGLGLGPYTPDQFMTAVLDKIVNKTGIAVMQKATPQLPTFIYRGDLPDEYQLSLVVIQAFTGQYWNLMNYFASAPFSELFYIDTPEGPTLFYRQPPYRDLDGSPLGVYQASSATLPTVTVALSDKKTHALGKSASEMYCFYMVYSDQTALNQGGSYNYAPFFGGQARNDYIPSAVTGSVGVNKPSNPIYDKDIEARFGFLDLNINTPFISAYPASATKQQATAWASGVSSISVSMNTWLYHAMRHNHAFESGEITVHGDPDLTIGRYILVPEWQEEFYVTGVNHTFIQYQSWETDVTVIRGYAYGQNTAPTVYAYRG